MRDSPQQQTSSGAAKGVDTLTVSCHVQSVRVDFAPPRIVLLVWCQNRLLGPKLSFIELGLAPNMELSALIAHPGIGLPGPLDDWRMLGSNRDGIRVAIIQAVGIYSCLGSDTSWHDRHLVRATPAPRICRLHAEDPERSATMALLSSFAAVHESRLTFFT